jgi:hypothetical protein
VSLRRPVGEPGGLLGEPFFELPVGDGLGHEPDLGDLGGVDRLVAEDDPLCPVEADEPGEEVRRDAVGRGTDARIDELEAGGLGREDDFATDREADAAVRRDAGDTTDDRLRRPVEVELADRPGGVGGSASGTGRRHRRLPRGLGGPRPCRTSSRRR